MDPRQRRTRDALARVIIELASTRSTRSITVSEVAQAAGVSRDTFYRHATSPARLLASVLDEQLEQLPMPDGDGATTILTAERQLLEHIAEHASIYENALVSGSEGEVREMLVRRIAVKLSAYAQLHPEILPHAADNAPIHEFAVSYAAHGTVGAIESWLRSADRLSVEEAASTIVAVSPSWWLRTR